MNCQICGRRSAPGARLCADCYAARKRAYDATITQPLVTAAERASRTLSRLRRSDNSPEAKARRAAKKAKAAARATEAAAPPPTPVAPAPARSRSTLWVLLSAGVVLAAIAGWYLPSHTPAAPETAATLPPRTSTQPSGVGATDLQSARITPPETAPVPAFVSPRPLVDRELAPALPADVKPAPAKRTVAPPRPAVPATEPPPVEIVRMPPRAAVVSALPRPAPRVDPWQEMTQAIGRCPDEGFLGRVVCEQRIRLQYCEGHWGQVTQCPGGPSADHG